MKWLQMDFLKMQFSDSTFDFVIDKGGLDALMAEDTVAIQNDAVTLFKEISRVLKNNGRYILISLLQEHILKQILHSFKTNWELVIHSIDKADSSILPYLLLFKKKSDNTETKILLDFAKQEFILNSENSEKAIIELIGEEHIKYKIHNQLATIKEGKYFKFDLWDSTQQLSTPRFSISIVDINKKN